MPKSCSRHVHLRWIFAIAGILAIRGNDSHAQGPPISGTAKVRTVPSANTVTTGGTVTVQLRINLTGVTGRSPANLTTAAVLGGYQVALTFNPARLKLLGANGGTSSGFTNGPTTSPMTTANVTGRVIVVSQNAGASSPTTPVGDVHVATLTFEGKSNGRVAVVASPMSVSTVLQYLLTGATAGPTSIPATGDDPTPGLGQAGSPTPGQNAVNVASPVTLSWAPASGATSYEVYLSTNTIPAFAAEFFGHVLFGWQSQ